MKFRLALIIIAVFALSACNLSLAEDITPPPDYVSPTPPPDLGPLYPEEPPSPARGAEFFAGTCALCHGEKGLGNGQMAPSMPVAVPAIGLRDISSQAAPADWYKTISLGNLERGMPPFVDSPAQDRWDVLAYTYTLSVSPEEFQRGKNLYEANCSDCHGANGSANAEVDFTNQEYMSQATSMSLYRGIAEGKGQMKSFASELTDEEIWALTGYLRSLSFDMAALEPTPTVTPAPSLTPEASASSTPGGTPSVEGGIVETPGPVKAAVSGSVTNASGSDLESGLTATLALYNTTDGQVFDSLTTEVGADGRFEFSDLFADAQTAYWVSVNYQGVSYYSDFAAYDGTTLAFDMPVVIYDSTTDWLTLNFDLIHIALNISADTLQANELYVISNTSTKTVIIETDGTSLPFIKLPEGVTELTSLAPDSRGASFLPAEGGIALPPQSEAQYVLVAAFSVPYEKRFEFIQEFPMPVSSMSLYALEDVRIKTEQLTDAGTQDFSGAIYQVYETSAFPAGTLAFTVSGTPGGTVSSGLSQRTWLIIGIGTLGVGFVGLGIFLFLRGRALAKLEELEDEPGEEPSEDALGSDPEALTDAIIALDEQLKNGEISKEAYEKRRAEFKARLKELL